LNTLMVDSTKSKSRKLIVSFLIIFKYLIFKTLLNYIIYDKQTDKF